MTYICAPIFVDLPLDNGVTVEFSPSLAPVVAIPGGPKGLDGISPTITVTDILGGHKVTITDKDGTETFDVMDGGISQEDFLKVFPQDIASSSVASFPDGADGVPVVELTVDITPVQSGSGDPSPSNVRPITGFSEAKVTVRGKNLYPYSTFPAYAYSWDSHRSFADAINPVFLKGGVTYVLSGGRDSQYTSWFFMIRMFDINKQVVTDPTKATTKIGAYTTSYNSVGQYFLPTGAGSTDLYQTFTPTIDCWIDVVVQSNKGVALNAMIEAGTTAATAYEQYNGTDVTIDLDGTRYGGTLDVLTGVLTVDYTGGVLDGSEWWRQGSGAIWFFLSVDGTYRTAVATAYTSHFKYAYNQNNSAWMVYGQIHVRPDTTIAPSGNTAEGLAEFKAWLAQNPVTFYTKLVTPIVIQLTPQEVETLLGTNNIWADTGNTTVKYRADIGLYVQKLTGSTEEDMTANVNIASGKYFMVGNTLYLSTTSIPAGDTIKPGTNCTLTNLAAALNALNA